MPAASDHYIRFLCGAIGDLEDEGRSQQDSRTKARYSRLAPSNREHEGHGGMFRLPARHVTVGDQAGPAICNERCIPGLYPSAHRFGKAQCGPGWPELLGSNEVLNPLTVGTSLLLRWHHRQDSPERRTRRTPAWRGRRYFLAQCQRAGRFNRGSSNVNAFSPQDYGFPTSSRMVLQNLYVRPSESEFERVHLLNHVPFR